MINIDYNVKHLNKVEELRKFDCYKNGQAVNTLRDVRKSFYYRKNVDLQEIKYGLEAEVLLLEKESEDKRMFFQLGLFAILVPMVTVFMYTSLNFGNRTVVVFLATLIFLVVFVIGRYYSKHENVTKKLFVKECIKIIDDIMMLNQMSAKEKIFCIGNSVRYSFNMEAANMIRYSSDIN